MRNQIRQIAAAAIVLTAMWIGGLAGQQKNSQDPGVLFRAAEIKEVTEGDLKGAMELYKKVAASKDRARAAQALLRMAALYRKSGDAEAQKIYQRIVREFPDQKEAVTAARAQLGANGLTTAVRGERAVWTGPKVDLFGRVSPDGRFISFTDWAGFANLSFYDLRTNKDRPLTGNKASFRDDPNTGEAQWSAVSPDSKSVAYLWINFREELCEARIVSTAEGGIQQPRQLLKFPKGECPEVRDWSSDGRFLALGYGGKGEVAIMNVADGSIRVLKSGIVLGKDARMFFSRDSRYLAVGLNIANLGENPQDDVFILGVDGKHDVRAVENAADDRVVGWSPDGKFLLFRSKRTPSWSLWAQPISNGRPQGAPQLVKTDIGESRSLGVTNNGALYLYKYAGDRDVKVARIDLTAGRLIGEPVHFSQGLLPSPWSAHWSPDGKYLAYPVRGEDIGIAIRSVDTGEVRQLLNVGPVQDLSWSPDGRSFIAKTENREHEGVFQIDIQSGRTTFIAETRGFSFPRWSADGTKIYYILREAQVVRERDMQTGVERDVFKNPGPGQIEISPDGKSLGARTFDQPSQTSSVWIVPLAGGEPRELFRIPTSATIGSWTQMSWTPDSRALLTARKTGTAGELWLTEVESGQGRKLDIDVSRWTTTEPGPLSAFALSPDGKSIAFYMGSARNEVWAMENFLSALK
ncbi:MAG TPA: hypothetical protein VFR18_06370 [Terriglobia bacterium]|nr:hypothetical protein [Terriglobia bacterium]